MIESKTSVLQVNDLEVCYSGGRTTRKVLHGVNLQIEPGESFGLVGESGCGKSTLAYAIENYLPRSAQVTRGQAIVNGKNVFAISQAELAKLRRKHLSIVYQDPAKALNPTMKVGRQLEEVYGLMGHDRDRRRQETLSMMSRVRISDPVGVLERYPHQLSGGMQQRICIAMALATNPSLLILDEPTTGLDATVEAEILDLIKELQTESFTAVLFISHNLAVIAKMCAKVGVLYAGRIVEQGPTEEIFREPRHPYTLSLLKCIPRKGRSKKDGLLQTIRGSLPRHGSKDHGCSFLPRCDFADEKCQIREPELTEDSRRLVRCINQDKLQFESISESSMGHQTARSLTGDDILTLDHVSKTFGTGHNSLKVLNDICLSLKEGETLGLVGESGSGKSTLARTILGLFRPDKGGSLTFKKRDLLPLLSLRDQDQIKALQIVFQNPDSALNRSHSVWRIITRAIRKLTGVNRASASLRAQDLARLVQLPEHFLHLKPSQLSGGLKQRVAIARAFSGNPKVVVCDEPTSALDVSVQAAILNLLVNLQNEERVSYIFISHDLSVVRYISDRVAVMYLGRIMEVGTAEEVFSGPHHPYTEALLASAPFLDVQQNADVRLTGEVPSVSNPPTGCVFHPRCPKAFGDLCRSQAPSLLEHQPGHWIRCHLTIEELSNSQHAALSPTKPSLGIGNSGQ